MTYLLLNQNGIEDNRCMQTSVEDYYRSNCFVNTMTSYQECSPSKKEKRFRSAFTTEQVNYLEKQFKKFPYIGNVHRKEVAMALNIPERAVKIWFQNRRMKEKKETGAKEFDDDQTNYKSMVFAKSKLNNVNRQSANEPRQYSLPTKIRKPISIKNMVTSNSYDMNLTRPIRFKDNSQKINSAPTFAKSNPSTNYKASAEFSIDLCKKYKKESPNKQISDTVLPKRDVKLDSGQKGNDCLNEQIIPEDLSFTSNTQASKKIIQVPQDPLNSVSNSTSYISVIPTIPPQYAQPYLTPSGVLWKPISVLPLVSSGSSSVPVSSNQIGPGSSFSKMSCICCCHSESLPSVPLHQNPLNPQYVVTTLPFQNPSAKH